MSQVLPFAVPALVQPAAIQAHADAEQFAKVLQRNWEGGLLVARSVRLRAGQGGEGRFGDFSPNHTGKVSARQYAEWAQVDHKTVTAYLKAWERAASEGLVPPAAELEPGQEVSLEGLPSWGDYYGLGLGGLKESEHVQWYTPAVYIEAAREVMGGIDLDPASSEMANETVQAPLYYDEQADGLAHKWHGRIWLNPPYGKGSGLFTTKLVEEYDAGRTTAAILLLNAYGFDSAWFQPLWDHLICFTDHRIQFTNPDRETGGPANANIFIYFGSHKDKFARVFSTHGAIVERIA